MTFDLILMWLLTYTAHSTLLIVATWILIRLVSGFSPAARTRLWRSALVGAIATSSVHLVLDLRPFEFLQINAAGLVDGAAGASGTALGPEDVVTEGFFPRRTVLLVAFWMLGVATVALHRLRSSLQHFHNLGERISVHDRKTVALLGELMLSADMKRSIRLTSSKMLRSPVAIGLSEICLPRRAALHLGQGETRAVLAHELAHLERFDPIWLIVSEIVETLFFFQPLNRLARSYAEIEAEYACDLRAIEWTGERAALAHSLANVARELHTNSSLAVVGIVGPKATLYDRVDQVLNATQVTEEMHSHLLSVALIVILAGSVALIGPSISVQAHSTSTETWSETVSILQAPPGPTARPPDPSPPFGIESVSAPRSPAPDPQPPDRRSSGPVSRPVPPR